MNSQMLQNIHIKEENNAREWALMLGAPQDHLVRAPSTTPFLASHTRFVRTLDIPYADTDNGAFCVAMLPNPLEALAFSGAPSALPAAGLEALALASLVTDPARFSPDYSDLEAGILLVRGNSGEILGTTAIKDLSTFSALLVNRRGVIVNCAGGYSLTISTSNYVRVTGSYLMPWYLVTIAGVDTLINGAPLRIIAGSTTFPSYAVAAGNTLKAFGLSVVDSTGAAARFASGATLLLGVNVGLGNVPIAAGSTTYGLASTELIEAGKVTLQRCTAMSLLLTNMAPPLTTGGEVVSARTNFSILDTDGGVPGLMDAIKRLPEERYWRSGPIVDGCYSWWLPDELASYEPLPIGQVPPTENILVSAGVMSAPGGFVRVIATWTFEFYTPVQLFSRSYNTSYHQSHRDMFDVLAKQRACSANAGHVALLGLIASAALAVHRFYSENREYIDPALRMVGQAVTKKLNTLSKVEPKNKNNKKGDTKAKGDKSRGEKSAKKKKEGKS